ncbi:MAG: hypothetical protein FJ076_06255 [Cyanobacteria bacterium K_DeepCast_35m_m1_288]|nr:hypothetical protein [Cyanobacteria bacterium K_DeepCast_35m_m1_288]
MPLSIELAACFTPDLEEARAQVMAAQARCADEDLDSLVRIVPLLTYLGAYDSCEALLLQRDLLRHAWGRQALFRIWRARGVVNPWRALIEAEHWPQWSAELKQALASPGPWTVTLMGGLGDALENLALILASVQQSPLRSTRLAFAPASAKARSALTPLLHQWFVAVNGGRDFSTPVFRCALAMGGLQRPPQVLWPAPAPAVTRPPQWLVCWRCKPDLRNPLSAYSRSLPWPVLQSLLLQLQPLLAAREGWLFDLTAYRPQELAWLAQHVPRLRPVQADVGDLGDTQALLRQCRGTITVDTSLVHLAALSGEPVTLLLPLFADERWLELLQPGSAYHRWVTPLRQCRFHCWQEPLQQLLQHFSEQL